MKKTVCLFFILILGISGQAQHNYDSLMAIWNNKSNHDTVRLNAMNDMLHTKAYLWKKLDSAATLANMQFELAEAKGLKKHMFYALRNQGLSYSLKVMNKEALEYDLKRLEIAEEISYIKGIAEALSSIGFNYSNLSDYPQALHYFERSAGIWEELNDEAWLWTTSFEIGQIYAAQGNILKANDYYQKCLELGRKHPEWTFGVIVETLNAIGELYEQLGDFPKALEYYYQNLRIEEDLWENRAEKSPAHEVNKQSPKLGIAEAHIKIGEIYKQQQNFDKALEHFHIGLEICKESTHSVMIFYSLIDVGNAYLQKGEYDLATEYLMQSLEIAENMPDHYMAIALFYLGDVYNEQAEYINALETYNQSAQLFEEMSNKSRLTVLYLKIGKVYNKQGKYDAAILWCTKGIEIAEMTNSYLEHVDACECLTEAYEKTGNHKLALNYYKIKEGLNDSLNLEETNKKLMQMEYDKKHLSDSLIMVRDKLNTELTYQASLSSERNTRNIFLLVGLGILLAAIASFLRMRYVRRTNKELAKKNTLIAKEKERAEASEKAKELFFNNISHEFRTPLTLIAGPLEEVLDNDIDENSRPNLKMMQRSVARLQGMINELLDLSKLEYGKIKLKVQEENIVHLTKQYLQSFESLADQKKIKLSFKSQADEYKVWVDAEQIRKVLANLLSNAFKFTDERGKVFVEMRENNESRLPTPDSGLRTSKGVLIKVTDTGKGIPPDQLPHIFDRFYQVVEDDQTHAGGSGIGLALTKELIELHHGTITVESHPGKGTSFMVFIPFGKEKFTEDEIVREGKVEESAPQWAIAEDISGHVIEDEITKKSEKPLLLIVEDNPDMKDYISSHLVKKYKLLHAKDGEQGLTMALEQVPDLIISDVMMPRMDGIAMTDRLKADERTSHIPVIMLTARASVESKIEGLETGADDYVTKPFNARELQTRVKNLIEQRTKLREHFAKELNAGITIPKENQLPSLDQKFIQKAVEVVNEHLSENEFDVNQFSVEMALSRSQLHRKIKALTNKSATEFIRTIRLNKAAELLKQKTDNITQIAYETGFNNLSWFAKAFKEQFEVNPSEYMKSKK